MSQLRTLVDQDKMLREVVTEELLGLQEDLEFFSLAVLADEQN